MKKHHLFILTLLLSVCQASVAQQAFSKWYFGQQAGLDFSSSPPIALSGNIVNFGEAAGTMSDINGNLLFYGDGAIIMNKNHVPMNNATGMLGDQSSSQGEIFVQQPGHDSIYYVFRTIGTAYLYYNVINMNLAAGLGSVTVKNATLYTPTCERQVAVRHCNGKDIWLLSKKYNSLDYYAYLLTENGLNTTPVITSIGDPLTNGNSYGQMKVSPDGKKIGVASNSGLTNGVKLQTMELYDFDAATGVISNSLSLFSSTAFINNSAPYGVEFSPDGSKLYISTIGSHSVYACSLWQWNICVPQNSITSTVYSLSLPTSSLTTNFSMGSIQRAIDGKLYIASPMNQSISVINNPNGQGSNMNFTFGSFSLNPKTSMQGLPNFINPFMPVKPSGFSQTIACQDMHFSAPAGISFTSGCNAMPYAYTGYVWDFGDPASGANNIATTQNGVHRFSNTGTYTVSVILQSPCRTDTLKQQVMVTSLSPPVQVTGTTTICKGEKRVYTASGATSYVWSNNLTTATVALNPTTSTVINVTGTSGNCSTTKSFSITVEPCTDIISYGHENEITLFPSPFTNELHLHTNTTGELVLTDYSGKVIFTKTLTAGDSNISTSELPAGIYFTTFTTSNGVSRGKVMKQ